MSRIVVFAGPTISQKQIHALVPAAEIRPPIAAEDLIRVALAPGDLVAIIDGFYFQSAAVRHKEILALLKSGVHVWGAASIGALRAAELASFGMRGFGRIFKAYLQGDIEGDDEVAILHAPKDMGYTNLTEALVNIRYACECAVAAGVISSDAHNKIVATATALPFHERTYPHILNLATKQGLSQDMAQKLQSFVQGQQLDLKRKDALELIQALCTPPQEPAEASFTLHETAFLRNWRISGQGTVIGDDMYVSDFDILTAYQLFSKGYPGVRYHILLEKLAEMAHRSLDVALSSDHAKVAEDRPEATLENAASGYSGAVLSEDALTDLVAQYVAKQCRINLHEELPERIRRWLQPREETLSQPQQLALLGVRLWQEPRSLSWQKIVIDRLKESNMFHSLLKIVVQSRIFNETLQEQDHGVQLRRLSSAQIYEWFMQRWEGERADWQFAILDRGFNDTADFLERARPFYLFDKYVGVSNMDREADSMARTRV
ncbi:MAG TPA: TfuA-like protein [Ktedonobacteraceae bacterium]|nr:TfuA-like protein [Ktedonobacteraceae bacterium]